MVFDYFCVIKKVIIIRNEMIQSMTGFGKGEAVFNNKKIVVEIRSLNAKQLDLNLRLPALYRQSESELRNIVARALQRGKVDVAVNIEAQGIEAPARINAALFHEYMRQMSEMLAGEGIQTDRAQIVPLVMRLPEVISAQGDGVSDEEHRALLAAAEAAATQLEAFRAQEGAVLLADLLEHVATIEACMRQVVPFEAARTEAIRTRIVENLDKLRVDVDRNRLEQEMIFYLEKLDITEEKVRLTNHCAYFREVAASEQGAGRKLGFIAQEMGREINTLGSKANEANIQRLVVQMKDELEKIKEQVLNIL